MYVCLGDIVEVIVGNVKGKCGKIIEVIVKKNCVIVEGVNMIKKYIKFNV